MSNLETKAACGLDSSPKGEQHHHLSMKEFTELQKAKIDQKNLKKDEEAKN